MAYLVLLYLGESVADNISVKICTLGEGQNGKLYGSGPDTLPLSALAT